MSSHRKTNILFIILASVVGLCVALGGLFKIIHWPGSNVLIVLGMSSACYVLIGFVIYLCILVGKDKLKPAIYKAFGIVALVLFAMAGSMLLVGAMFHIMHWPGGRINMIMGAVFAVPALVATIIAIANKNKKKQLNN